jgi:hypothetical protein
VSACVSATDQVMSLPPNTIFAAVSALPLTATMPTGTASYQGSYSVVQNTDFTVGSAVDRWTETSTADLTLNANFATRAITAGLGNLVISGYFETSAPNSAVQTDRYFTAFSGQSTGTGVITTSGGVIGFNADLMGTFTARLVGTTESSAVAATGDAIFTVNDPISIAGEFRGPNAEAVLGLETLDLGAGSKTTTLIATRR